MSHAFANTCGVHVAVQSAICCVCPGQSSKTGPQTGVDNGAMMDLVCRVCTVSEQSFHAVCLTRSRLSCLSSLALGLLSSVVGSNPTNISLEKTSSAS